MQSTLNKSIYYLTLSSLLEKASPFLLNAYLIRILTPSNFIELSLLLAFTTICRTFIDFGQDSFNRVQMNKDFSKTYNIFPSFLPWVIGFFVASIITYIFLKLDAISYSRTIDFLLCFSYCVILHLYLILKSICVSRERPAAVLQSTLILIVFDCSLFFILHFSFDLDGMIARLCALCGSTLIAAIYIRLNWYKSLAITLNFKKTHLDAVWYGGPLFIHGSLIALIFYIDKKILQSAVSSIFLTEIIVASTLILPLILLSEAIGKATFPRIIRLMKINLESKIKDIILKAIGLITIATLAYLLCIKPLAELYVPAKMETRSFYGVLLIMCLAAPLKLTSQMIGRIALYHHKTWLLTITTLTAGSIYLLTLYIRRDTVGWLEYGTMFIGFYSLHALILFFLTRFNFGMKTSK